MKKGWISTTETIKRTQRDYNYMNQIFNKYGLSKSKDDHSSLSSQNKLNLSLKKNKRTDKKNIINKVISLMHQSN